jgi:hypothetical protein
MYELRINKAKVGSAQVFRCEGWRGALIISEEIKDAFDRMGATGTRFEEVESVPGGAVPELGPLSQWSAPGSVVAQAASRSRSAL